MKDISLLFFGSTEDSVVVLEKLAVFTHPQFSLHIAAVITQPARPVGRTQTITKTPVQVWAESHNTPVLSFPSNREKPWLYEDEPSVINTLETFKADFIVSASYGQKIPTKILTDAKFGGLNVHPSILPRWRGGDPVPWAILSGDHQIGVTVVSLSEKFDEGIIYAQEKIPITPKDTSDPLRTKLFEMGAGLLVEVLPLYFEGKAKGKAQLGSDEPRAKRFTRDLGFEPWETLLLAQTSEEEAARIERKFRALNPWPGIWTKVTNSQNDKATNRVSEKRVKILSLILDHGKLAIEQVQLEGKNPVSWKQFVEGYNISTSALSS